MKPETARTLVVLSGICIAIGLSAQSPSLTLILAAVAAAAAAAPALLAPRTFRIWGMVLLGVAILLALLYFGEFRDEQGRYLGRARERAQRQNPPAQNPAPVKGEGR